MGIYWSNHHHMLAVARHVSGGALWANLHLLFWLSLFPFATAWMGENHFVAVPAAAYGVVLMAAIAYWLLQQKLIEFDAPDSLPIKPVFSGKRPPSSDPDNWPGQGQIRLGAIGAARGYGTIRRGQKWGNSVRFWLGVTDNRWFQHVSASASPEVNFWQPSARPPFSSLPEGMLFLFKLKAPYRHIAGGGRFVRYTQLPLMSAWSVFEQQNGTSSLSELRTLIASHRQEPTNFDTEIGCTVLTDVFYLPPERWIDVGERFHRSIMVGKTYEDTNADGASILADLDLATNGRSLGELDPSADRFGRPFLQRARLGQGSFRTLVIDAYQRRCAITAEHTLPVLEAAHILPYADHGPHHINNGLLLRSDFHKLFDAGLVTVEPDLKVRVSGRIRDRYFNGKAYYRLHGQTLAALPSDSIDHPDPGFLRWHNQNKFVE